jgi:hypothetical protein
MLFVNAGSHKLSMAQNDSNFEAESECTISISLPQHFASLQLPFEGVQVEQVRGFERWNAAA